LGRKDTWAQLAERAGEGLMDPILIDECLSPKLASVARERGLTAFHVVWVNLEGAEDWDLAAIDAERDYVFVTTNRRNFLRLYAELEVHNGLIIIVPTVSTADQMRLFAIALDAAERQDSLVNLLIEVQVEVRNWARSDPRGAD
jgi:predicted nuclease of predicted toxin-antitoxin system